MPIYEYRCQDCEEQTSQFFRSISAVRDIPCPACGSARLARLVSPTNYVKGEAARLAGFDTSRVLGNLDGKDVGSFERWARRTGAELDSALGSNFRELAEQAAAGEDPSQRIDPGFTLRAAVERRASEISGSGSGPSME